MAIFKKGDVVLFDDKEHTYVSFDEENNEHIIEDEDGDQFAVTDLQENETAAAKTIKAKPSAATSPSKSQMMSAVIQHINTVPSSDAVDFFNKMMAQIGKESEATSGKAAGNEASIKAKPSHASPEAVGDRGQLAKHSAIFDEYVAKTVKEEIAEIFGEEDLSEEFKDKVTTLFETAVNIRVSAIVAEITEELEAKFDEALKEATEQMEEGIDKYLSYVAEEWMSDNEVAIDFGIKEQMAESFLHGLKNLFVEHYHTVPADKVDAYEELSVKFEALEEQLNSALSENAELVDLLAAVNAEEVVKEVSEGLAMTQKEKFKALVEHIEFDGDEDAYKAKLETIKEHYFSSKKAPPETTLFEEVDIDDNDGEKKIAKGPDPEVNRIAEALGRFVKK